MKVKFVIAGLLLAVAAAPRAQARPKACAKTRTFAVLGGATDAQMAAFTHNRKKFPCLQMIFDTGKAEYLLGLSTHPYSVTRYRGHSWGYVASPNGYWSSWNYQYDPVTVPEARIYIFVFRQEPDNPAVNSNWVPEKAPIFSNERDTLREERKQAIELGRFWDKYRDSPPNAVGAMLEEDALRYLSREGR